MKKIYTIEKAGAFGEGVARDNGKTVFIKGALPGEVVEAQVVLDKKKYSVARLTKILSPCPQRVKPPCKYFGRCGGCSLQNLSYEAQLEFKAQSVRETLLKVGGLDVAIDKVVASDREYRYRNKLSFPVRGEKIGLYMENSHDVVDISDCLLQREWDAALVNALRKFMRECGLTGYDERKGDVRHIVAREKNGSVCITLVTTRRINIDAFLDYIPFDNFALYENVNAKNNNVILGDEFFLVGGKGALPDFHPASFYQVNDFIEGKLYADVLAECEGDVVVDSYCGAGNLSLMIASKAKRVYGIEICRQAVDEAVRRANEKGCLNAEFICGDCKTALPRLVDKLLEEKEAFAAGNEASTSVVDNLLVGNEASAVVVDKLLAEDENTQCNKTTEPVGSAATDKLLAGNEAVFPQDETSIPQKVAATVVVDPPRKGVDETTLNAIIKFAPQKIVYVSCNPATLARDLKLLLPFYTPSRVNVYDMFPLTPHVETLVLLSKKSAISHIDVRVEFGEGEGQISLKEVERRAEERKPKEKVTYKMIQDYIEKTYGFKVHTAYIAEVKRSLGLPMYDAPNAVEELKRPRSHPSPQMVEAIKETLKHFEII